MQSIKASLPMTERLRQVVDALYTTKYGGTLDTSAALLVASSLTMSSPALAPFLSSFPFNLTPIAFAAIGGGWFANRLLIKAKNDPIMESSMRIRSDDTPYTPNPQETSCGGLLLGYRTDTGEPVYVDWEHLLQHIFILGASGVGKTVAASTLMFQHIQAGGGLLFIDGKIDQGNLEQIHQFASYCGRQHDLYIINTDDPANSNTYNPLLFGDPDEKADALLQQIPSTESNPGADFYKQEAKKGLTTLIRALQTAKLAYNMIDLTVLLSSGEALLDLERKLNNVAPGSDASKEFALFLNGFRPEATEKNPNPGLDLKKIKDTFGGMAGRLYSFGTGKFGEIMNTYQPDINLYEAIRTNKIIYVALATMGKDVTARNFGKMVIADLRTCISWLQRLPKQERPWPPCLAFCDEAGSYLNESWSRIPEQSRSAHVIFAPAMQTVANAQAISEELYQMIIGNAWNKIFFKVSTSASAEEAAELVGKYYGVAESLTTSSSKSVSTSLLSSTPDQNNSSGVGLNQQQREEERYIVSADDFKRLSKGEAIVTWGDRKIFSVRVPRLEFDEATIKAFGPPRVNRFRTKGITIDGVKQSPAGYFDNVERYLTGGSKSEVQSFAENERATDRKHSSEIRTKVNTIRGKRGGKDDDVEIESDEFSYS